MRTLTLLVIFSISFSSLFAQKALDLKGDKIKDSRIYLVLDGETLKYFTHDKTQDGEAILKSEKLFSLKGENNCNIYLKWLNPIKYRVSWKDTVFIDERDKIVSDFINLLSGQFGKVLTELNQGKSYEAISKAFSDTTKSYKPKDTKLDDLKSGFNSIDLTSLYVNLFLSESKLTKEDIEKINQLTKALKELDDKAFRDFNKLIDNLFTELYNETDPKEAESKVSKTRDIIKDDFTKDIKFMENLTADIENKLKDTKLNDPLLNSLFVLSINNFINQTSGNISKAKQLIDKLEPILKLIDNSLKDESVHQLTTGFYKVKYLDFENGKKFQTSLIVDLFKYDSDKVEFSKEKELATRKLTFERYDFFAVSVSTGLFYSNTTLKGYGVSTNSNSELIISEDDINRSSPVTAVFLNFNFGVGSRYFAPLAQIGIDPTKKRPFMLMGGGFSIPSARIAFSAGPIWTWNQSLDKLSVGQTINSTTNLEKDVKYRFEIEPKGWYLGIQYNF